MQELNFPFSHGHHICSTHHKSWDHRSELRSPRGRCSLIVPASFPEMKQFVSQSHTWSWCLQTCFPWLVSEMPGFLLRCGGQNWARGCQRSPPCVCAEAGKYLIGLRLEKYLIAACVPVWATVSWNKTIDVWYLVTLIRNVIRNCPHKTLQILHVSPSPAKHWTRAPPTMLRLWWSLRREQRRLHQEQDSSCARWESECQTCRQTWAVKTRLSRIVLC